jgi:putative membrane protein
MQGHAVSNGSSLNTSMDIAVKRYSSLFKLPPYKSVLLLQSIVSVLGISVATYIAVSSWQAVTSFALGFSVLLINIVSDYLVSALVLKNDPVFDFRRTASFSLYCLVLWLFFIFVGACLSVLFGPLWWVRLVLLGFSAVLIFRSVVFNATSTMSSYRIFTASLLQPLPCMLPFLIIWFEMGYAFAFQLWAFLIFAVVVAISASFVFTSSLNRLGTETLGVASLSILKAFLLNWIIGLNDPLERVLERLGEEQDTSISLIKFSGTQRDVIIAVPSIHPGPFKNVGSSPLPSLLKSSLEKELDCVACVPHGLYGHEVDLTSQAENQKVIDNTLKGAGFPATEGKATSLVTTRVGQATASCQIFGKCAFISFTLSPLTTEDFPPELGAFVRHEAARLGIEHCVIVNAHNCIGKEPKSEEAFESLKRAATQCLREAISEIQVPFEVGAGTVNPTEFSLEDGMGAGGITVVRLKVGEKHVGYVVIDGNNIVSGLREKIQSFLATKNILKTEVFTTDTHSVSAVILTERGYYPVGEVMDHEKLIGCIERAVVLATMRMESSQSGCSEISLPKVKVIGEKQLEALCMLIDRSLRRAKRLAVPLFIGSGLLLILFLLLL